MTMSTMNRKKSRLRLVLLMAAAMGTSAATLSGALATLTVQSSGSPTISA